MQPGLVHLKRTTKQTQSFYVRAQFFLLETTISLASAGNMCVQSPGMGAFSVKLANNEFMVTDGMQQLDLSKRGRSGGPTMAAHSLGRDPGNKLLSRDVWRCNQVRLGCSVDLLHGGRKGGSTVQYATT